METKSNFDTEISYWKEQLETPRYASNLNELVENINKYKKYKGDILELGCGISHHISRINSPKENLYAIDTSEELLKLNEFEANYFKEDALNMPKEWENKFEVIFCNGLIHHIKDHDLLLQEVRRCLQEGGLFIFLEPTSISLSGLYFKIKHFLLKRIGKDKVQKMSGFIDEEEKYINYFVFQRKLKENGFDKIKYYTRQLIRLPPLRILRKVNVEPINNKINIPFIGTTLVGVWMYHENEELKDFEIEE